MNAVITVEVPVALSRKLREAVAKLEALNENRIAKAAEAAKVAVSAEAAAGAIETWQSLKDRGKRILLSNLVRLLLEKNAGDVTDKELAPILEWFDQEDLLVRGRPRGNGERGR